MKNCIVSSIRQVIILSFVIILFAAATSEQQLHGTWAAHFKPTALQVKMDTEFQVQLNITNIDIETQRTNYYQLRSINTHLATVLEPLIIHINDIDARTRAWSGNISMRATFIGRTNISVNLIDALTNRTIETSANQLELTIVRPQRVLDHIFTGSVILCCTLLFINFGAALDMNVFRSLLVRPVAPTIGFLCQFLIMPTLSYGLGVLIFPHSPEMQLGLFFTGVSPSGGASNIWTVMLGGNINLSVLMTTISNFAAFGMMPFWIFTLGRLIFERGNMAVPYQRIATTAFGLVIALAIGVGIQKCSERLTRILVRLLKPISMCLILFIIVFAVATNLYLFELFSWQIVVAGIALPWLGYILAWLVSKACRQNFTDALTIAIETGIQNTGISILLLSLGLPQPQADLTTVIPVSVAIMTPLPLLAFYFSKRFRSVKNGDFVGARMIDDDHSN